MNQSKFLEDADRIILAHVAGQQAHSDGTAITANPHSVKDTVPWKAWRAGWIKRSEIEGDSLEQIVGEATPKAGRPKVHANPAARQAAWRARHQLGQLTVELPSDVIEGLHDYMDRQMMNGDADKTLSGVITHLVRSQLMRKR